MNLTSIVNKLYFKSRRKELDQYTLHTEDLQQEVMLYLLNRANNTEYGRNHLFSTINKYEEFTQNIPINTYEELKKDIDRMRHGEENILWPGKVKWYAKSSGTTNDKSKFIPITPEGIQNIPINTYEELKKDIDRMRHGEENILWPGKVKWYAKSSGTTNDKSKFIPITPEGIQNIHYKGSTDVVACYLDNNPKSRMFEGKGLILGGSHSPNYNLPNSLVGDLSAILIENINPLANLVRVPKKQTALLSDFEVKRDLIAQETLNKNITNISGVPSWMLSVLVRVMELSGKQHLEDVWPNLEVFFHGGISFTPYRKQYEQLITKSDMHYMETYNASEGFFGVQNDPNDKSMMLMVDYGVFYEFLPMDEFGNEHPNIVPLSGIELDRNYAIIISTSCGLWRYMIGDTIKFTSKNPYKFIITGRTKYFINAFGEELIMDNAEKGLAEACKVTKYFINAFGEELIMDNAEYS